jgi:hypothetical protein
MEARSRDQAVPALDSLIPPVRGDLAPAEMRLELGAAVPVTIPGQKASLLKGPRGWARGGTSAEMMEEDNPRPPKSL